MSPPRTSGAHALGRSCQSKDQLIPSPNALRMTMHTGKETKARKVGFVVRVQDSSRSESTSSSPALLTLLRTIEPSRRYWQGP